MCNCAWWEITDFTCWQACLVLSFLVVHIWSMYTFVIWACMCCSLGFSCSLSLTHTHMRICALRCMPLTSTTHAHTHSMFPLVSIVVIYFRPDRYVPLFGEYFYYPSKWRSSVSFIEQLRGFQEVIDQGKVHLIIVMLFLLGFSWLNKIWISLIFSWCHKNWFSTKLVFTKFKRRWHIHCHHSVVWVHVLKHSVLHKHPSNMN